MFSKKQMPRGEFLRLAGVGGLALSALPLLQRRADATVYFSDNFDRATDTFSDWEIFGSTITTDSAVVRAGTHSAKFSANNANTAEGSRADLHRDGMFFNGDERYIGFSVYFPSNIRSQFTSNGWGVLFAEPGYYPGGHYPPIALYFNPNISGANPSLRMDTHEPNGSANKIWSNSSVALGQWVDIVLRMYFHDTSAGWVEMWIDGVKQTFTNGQQRYSHHTIPPGGGSSPGGSLIHLNYRQNGIASNVTLYQDELKVGDSYAAVAPSATSVSRTLTIPIAASVNDRQWLRRGGSYPASSTISGYSSNQTVFPQKALWNGTYYIAAATLAFDTSSIPDGALLTDAKLRFVHRNTDNTTGAAENVNGRNLNLEWFSGFTGTTSDWIANVTNSAGDIALSSLGGGQLVTKTLSSPANINKSGITYLRAGISGTSAPTGINKAGISTFDHATDDEPRLIVNYTL
jgi:hypothetical protein